MSIADRKIPFVEIDAISDLMAIKAILDKPKEEREQILGFPVKTIVIDTIDEVQGMMIEELLKREKKAQMGIQDWGKVADEMKALIRGFRNLDLHVVFTCHLKTMTDETTGRSWYAPGMAGQIADKIPGYVDLSLMIHTATVVEATAKGTQKVDKRLLETYPTATHPFLKDRSGKLPHSFEVNFQDDFERIENLIFGDLDALPSSEEMAEVYGEDEQSEGGVTEDAPKTDKAESGTKSSSAAILAAKKLRG